MFLAKTILHFSKLDLKTKLNSVVKTKEVVNFLKQPTLSVF